MTLLTVDGSNAIYRAHHAVPPMDYKGTPTNAVVGFMRIVKSNLRLTEATHCAVTFDLPGKNFRHELFAEYKQGREKKPEVEAALKIQIPIIADLCRACGLRMVGKKNIEGDDLIGTLAVRYATLFDLPSHILSSDKDFAAMMAKHKKICLINPAKGGIIRRKDVPELFGVKPSQMVDYLMLEGDDVDNIPGVPGVGIVTARKMLAQYKRVEDVPMEMFPKKWRDPAAFKQLKKQFKLTRKLVTIRTDVIDLDVRKLERQPTDKEWLKEICTEFGLKRLYSELLSM